jgi:hypothetical protein
LTSFKLITAQIYTIDKILDAFSFPNPWLNIKQLIMQMRSLPHDATI